MYAGFRYAVVVLSILTIFILLLPLLFFAWDIIQNPECIVLKFENASYINSEEIKADMVVSYCSSIPLRNVRIQVGSRSLEFDLISREATFKQEIILTERDLEEGIRVLEANIGGLYRLILKFEKA